MATSAWRVGGLAALVLVAACGVSQKKFDGTLESLAKCQAGRDECSRESVTLRKQIAHIEMELGQEKEARQKMEASLSTSKAELEELRRARAESEKRLAAFKALTARFQSMIDSGQIKVQFRKGRMLVELPSGVLFGSGRADLSKEGKDTLGQVVNVLREFPDRAFMVAGHTDNVAPGRSGKYKTNWDLSAARAVTVTKFMIDAGMSGPNMSAAGMGEYDPVADNGTDEGKAQNRRIEIILVPNLEELPSMPSEAPASPPPS